MKDKPTVVETLRKVILLENSLNDLSQLRDEAFCVFGAPLDQINQIFKPYWKELLRWNSRHEGQGLPYLSMQKYDDVNRAFIGISNATINRKEFEDALSTSCENVDKCIEEIRSKLSEEEEKLGVLYDDFTQSTGDFKFIFESPIVKQLIMDKLLKS